MMCQYEYYQWQKCGHKSIEITEYCNTAFWRAGMTARLNPCPEQNFRAFFVRVGILDGLDFGTCKWIGQSGYCKLCEEEFHVCVTGCSCSMFLVKVVNRKTGSFYNDLLQFGWSTANAITLIAICRCQKPFLSAPMKTWNFSKELATSLAQSSQSS